MPLKASIGDRELAEIALYVGEHPQLKPKEINRWIIERYKVRVASAYAARARLKKLSDAVEPDKCSTVVVDASTNTSRVPPPPRNPLEIRAAIIAELYHTMLDSPRPDDRTAASKELSRLLGFHREDLQDRIGELDLRKEDPVGRCRRIALEFRKAIGMSLDDIPAVLRELNPEVPDEVREPVPALPAAIPDRPQPDEAGVQVSTDRADLHR